MRIVLFILSALLFTSGYAQSAFTEEQKITHLLLFVANLNGSSFMRNGTEHTPKHAAEHLKMKREKAGRRIKTATAFIENIASKSSLTGEIYHISFPNGKQFPSGMVLSNELKKLEEGKVTLREEK